MDDQNQPSLSDVAAQNGSDGSGPPPQIDPSQFEETPAYQQSQESQPQAQPQDYAQNSAPQGDDNAVLEHMKSRGYDVSNFSSDEDFINETESRYAAASQAEQQLAAQQQYLQEQQLQQNLSKYEQSPPEEKEAGEPKFDESWSNLVEQDENGRFVIRPEYVGSVDPHVAEKVNDYVSWRQQRSNELIDDPVNTIMEAGLKDTIQSQINNAVQSAMSQSNTRSQAQEFIASNAETLYVKDPQTGKMQVDNAGNPVLSPVGQALNSAHVMLRNQGMYDPVQRHQVATQMVQNHFTQQQLASFQQQQQQPQQQPQQQAQEQGDYYKNQYAEQPFAHPTNPLPPGYMPNTPMQSQSNALGANGAPEHTSLGSLATALAVHKGFLQPKLG